MALMKLLISKYWVVIMAVVLGIVVLGWLMGSKKLGPLILALVIVIPLLYMFLQFI